MKNFEYYNPTRIVFGKGTIAKLAELVEEDSRVLLIYGGGSIKQNGVYQQVRAALGARTVFEFNGIEPNPHYETCLKAVELARRERVDFLLAVGGGSVIDATKFIAAALDYGGSEPWDILLDWSLVQSAMPFGAVLTLPGTGSEMNGGSVISNKGANQKLYFMSESTFPAFSILDPETTFSLPERQFANGTTDAYVQVLEQYLTYPADAPLTDRYAEGLMLTILEEAPKIQADPRNYAARANLMWCATQALNGLIGCGVPQDWASHQIGHELTALYGIDHGRTLAVVMPRVLRHQKARKREKLLQYAARVWGILDGSEDDRIEQAVVRTERFFQSLGVGTRKADYQIPAEAAKLVAERLAARGALIGEHMDLGRKEVEEILAMGD